MTLFELLQVVGLLSGIGLAIWFGAKHGLLAALLAAALAIPAGILLGVVLAFALILVAHYGIRLEDWIRARLPRWRRDRSPEREGDAQ